MFDVAFLGFVRFTFQVIFIDMRHIDKYTLLSFSQNFVHVKKKQIN